MNFFVFDVTLVLTFYSSKISAFSNVASNMIIYSIGCTRFCLNALH